MINFTIPKSWGNQKTGKIVNSVKVILEIFKLSLD